MYGSTAAGKLFRPLIDMVTKSLTSIPTDHANIHAGIAYGAWYKFAALGAGASGYITIVTPTDKYAHFKPTLFSTDGPNVSIDLAEDSTTVADGAAITPRNKRRVAGTAGDVAKVLVYSGPTTPVMGTIIDSDFVGGGTGQGQSKTGASQPNTDELVLKLGAKYLMRVTNNGAAAVNAHVKMFWYEEPAG